MSRIILALSLLTTSIQAITTAPGPVVITTTPSSISFASAATCAPPAQEFQTYCCSGTLVFPVPTASPQGSYTTQPAVAVAKRSEPNALVPSHSVHILPGTELAPGVTCFGSVAVVPTGGAGASATDSASGLMTMTGSASGSASATSSGAASTGSTSSVSGAASTSASAALSSVVSSISSGVSSAVSGSSTPSTGAAAAVGQAWDSTIGYSGVAGLLAMVMAML